MNVDERVPQDINEIGQFEKYSKDELEVALKK
jgi:hypothetical protein